jgi:hypothetical protein
MSIRAVIGKVLPAVMGGAGTTASRQPVTRASTYGMGGMKRDEDEKLGRGKAKKRAASRELLG